MSADPPLPSRLPGGGASWGRIPLAVADRAEDAAALCAGSIAGAMRAAAVDRGVATLALSGGATVLPLLHALARESLPWDCLHVFQVDERFAPDGSPDRNLTGLAASLGHAPLPPERIHAMPVDAPDPAAAARAYAESLIDVAGCPPVLDLVQLGLGEDGHTASLVPDDPALEVSQTFVALTSGPYAGWRRMTLTFRTLACARRILWLVTGEAKQKALARLLAGDGSCPAAGVRRDRAEAIADRAAASTIAPDV